MLQFVLPATDRLFEPIHEFFFESPAGLGPNMREVASTAHFAVPNNYLSLCFIAQRVIVDDLQEIIDEQTEAMAPFEWCRIPITFSGGQTTIFCCNLPEDLPDGMLVRQANDFQTHELEQLLQRFSS